MADTKLCFLCLKPHQHYIANVQFEKGQMHLFCRSDATSYDGDVEFLLSREKVQAVIWLHLVMMWRFCCQEESKSCHLAVHAGESKPAKANRGGAQFGPDSDMGVRPHARQHGERCLLQDTSVRQHSCRGAAPALHQESLQSLCSRCF